MHHRHMMGGARMSGPWAYMHGLHTMARFFHIQVQLQDGSWVRFERGVSEQHFDWPARLLFVLGILLISVLVLSLIGVRSIIRPLRDLKLAAEGLGKDIRQPPLAATGPIEVRETAKAFNTMLPKLYRLFVDYDGSLLEINPLVITADRESVLALDAKMDFDSNALYRHKDLLDYRDPDEEDPLEIEDSKYNMNYIKLDGNVGNMVNGAGQAMATMDIIKQAGAEPANFLDVGGGANEEMVENGFRIIMSDKNVKGILINIFGGILRCDILAQGVVNAAKKTGIKIPVVIRMEGTNVEKGRQILSDSGLNLNTAVDLNDAAKKVADIVAN